MATQMHTRTGRSPQDKAGNTPLARYVRDFLPNSYELIDEDLRWLDIRNDFGNGKLTNKAVVKATAMAARELANGNLDPFGLLMEAGICDIHHQPQ